MFTIQVCMQPIRIEHPTMMFYKMITSTQLQIQLYHKSNHNTNLTEPQVTS